MIDHIGISTTRYDIARAFYDAVFAALGYPRVHEMAVEQDPTFPGRRMCVWGPDGRHVFWLVEASEPASSQHIAFAAPDRTAVDAFHAAGLATGGTDNGPPGPRPVYHPGYYASFLHDPDGNNVEAVNHR
jgi:catechol 2,3-dioxygenase-like lactoylglutathione lyase family enzyme